MACSDVRGTVGTNVLRRTFRNLTLEHGGVRYYSQGFAEVVGPRLLLALQEQQNSGGRGALERGPWKEPWAIAGCKAG